MSHGEWLADRSLISCIWKLVLYLLSSSVTDLRSHLSLRFCASSKAGQLQPRYQAQAGLTQEDIDQLKGVKSLGIRMSEMVHGPPHGYYMACVVFTFSCRVFWLWPVSCVFIFSIIIILLLQFCTMLSQLTWLVAVTSQRLGLGHLGTLGPLASISTVCPVLCTVLLKVKPAQGSLCGERVREQALQHTLRNLLCKFFQVQAFMHNTTD